MPLMCEWLVFPSLSFIFFPSDFFLTPISSLGGIAVRGEERESGGGIDKSRLVLFSCYFDS